MSFTDLINSFSLFMAIVLLALAIVFHANSRQKK